MSLFSKPTDRPTGAAIPLSGPVTQPNQPGDWKALLAEVNELLAERLHGTGVERIARVVDPEAEKAREAAHAKALADRDEKIAYLLAEVARRDAIIDGLQRPIHVTVEAQVPPAEVNVVLHGADGGRARLMPPMSTKPAHTGNGLDRDAAEHPAS